jgi:hypothetical protein
MNSISMAGEVILIPMVDNTSIQIIDVDRHCDQYLYGRRVPECAYSPRHLEVV